MGNPHKWAKEIKAWADGAEIEVKVSGIDRWSNVTAIHPQWHEDNEYRVKPQPKEPQYLYVFFDPNYGIETKLIANKNAIAPNGMEYIGKIKLETD